LHKTDKCYKWLHNKKNDTAAQFIWMAGSQYDNGCYISMCTGSARRKSVAWI